MNKGECGAMDGGINKMIGKWNGRIVLVLLEGHSMYVLWMEWGIKKLEKTLVFFTLLAAFQTDRIGIYLIRF